MTSTSLANTPPIRAIKTAGIIDHDLVTYAKKVNERYFDGKATVSEIVFGIPDQVITHKGMVVPAAGLYPETRRVVIHQALREMRCPQYVFNYLIHHELAHLLYPPVGGEVHPWNFCARERNAPHRLKAIAWLEKKGFPVFRVS